MKRFAALFTCSYQELKQTRTITVCAMMAAVSMVLGTFTIYLTDTLRIGFSGIPSMLSSFLFGPVVGSFLYGAVDVLKYMMRPAGPFMPGLTLVVMLKGIMYGCAFYKKPLSLWRVLAAHLAVAVVCNLFLNTLCLSLLYGKGFLALLAPRIMRNLIMWPVDSLIFYNVAKALGMMGVFRIMGKSKAAA